MSWNAVKADCELGMRQIFKWLQNNLLTLNTSKTNFICFSINSRTQPNPDFHIRIHQCANSPDGCCTCPIIKKISHTKYLGVVVDERLSWYPQIEQLASRVRKFNWMFKSLRHVTLTKKSHAHDPSTNLLNQIYIALV
jgi:hypothetical protein